MSFPAYPANKESGVEWLGEVPGHWNVTPLKFSASCNDAVLPDSTDEDYEIKYVEISDVNEISGITGSTSYKFSDAPSRARRMLQDGDVLISTVRTYLRAIAPVVTPPENLIASTGFAVIRPRKGILDGTFLGYLLRAEWWISEVIARSVGVSYPAINASDLIGLNVPVPAWHEQIQSARFLDHETARIDALIEEQQCLVELLKEKRQAVISHAVTKGLDPKVPMKDSGVEWLGEVPAHWELTAVKYVVESMSQGWSPQCDNYPAQDGEWGVLKVGCVNGGVFNPAENKRLPEELEPDASLAIKQGDLLISRANTRDLVGSAAVAVSDYPWLMLCDKIYRLRLNAKRVAPELLALYLGSSAPRSQIELAASGASDSMQNISQSVVMDMPLPLPPVGEQEAILRFLRDTLKHSDELVEDVTIQRRLLQERRSALISAAVTGKIDVRGWQPSTDAPSPELAKEAV